MSDEPVAPPASCEPAISVALVEDEAGTRERLVQALGQTSRLCLAHAAGTGQELLDWLGDNSVDVLLVDLGLPDIPGLEVIRRARALSPGTEIMVITLFGDEANMMRAFEAGARGYLLKDGTEDDLARHVLNLHAGGSPMTPIIARQLLARLATPRRPRRLRCRLGRSFAATRSPRANTIFLSNCRGGTPTARSPACWTLRRQPFNPMSRTSTASWPCTPRRRRSSRRASSAFFSAIARALAVWLVLCAPQWAWAQGLVIRDAVATLEVDGGVPVSKHLTLPHRWDDRAICSMPWRPA